MPDGSVILLNSVRQVAPVSDRLCSLEMAPRRAIRQEPHQSLNAQFWIIVTAFTVLGFVIILVQEYGLRFLTG